MYMMLNFMIMPFFISLMLYSFNYKNILLTLICLEFMMINTIHFMYIILNLLQINMYFMFFFLTLIVCEGVLGLTILVYMIRNSGNDYLNLLNLLKW